MERFRQKELLRLAPGEMGIEQFAMQVVAILVGNGGAEQPILKAALVDLFVRAARTGDAVAFHELLTEMKRQRISAEAAVDLYIPAAAAEIGEQWHADKIDILQATVAISRLQNLVRELGRAWSADGAPETANSASILVMVPQAEQHTLGAMIVTSKLRRLGVSVCVRLMPTPADLERTLASSRFDAAFISLSNISNMDACKRLTETIRACSRDEMKVAMGGSAVSDPDAASSATYVDYAGNDVCAALAALGISAQTRQAG